MYSALNRHIISLLPTARGQHRKGDALRLLFELSIMGRRRNHASTQAKRCLGYKGERRR